MRETTGDEHNTTLKLLNTKFTGGRPIGMYLKSNGFT